MNNFNSLIKEPQNYFSLANRSCEIELDNCQFNKEGLYKLLGLDQPPRYTIVYKTKVQNRIHRKKRINKKWAKNMVLMSKPMNYIMWNFK